MKTQMYYEQAKFYADVVMAVLQPGCQRIAIAGSLRRKKDVIGDIELVAVPRFEMGTDLLGEPIVIRSLLDEVVSANYKVLKGGDKYKQFDAGPCLVDLFIQPDPATWGVNMMIRTGNDDFSKWMVTPRQQGGAMPGWMRSEGARLWAGDQVLETPEEEDVFWKMGLRWIDPIERVGGYWGRVGVFLKG